MTLAGLQLHADFKVSVPRQKRAVSSREVAVWALDCLCPGGFDRPMPSAISSRRESYGIVVFDTEESVHAAPAEYLGILRGASICSET